MRTSVGVISLSYRDDIFWTSPPSRLHSWTSHILLYIPVTMSDPITTDQEQHLPSNPEDRKAAAALSSLNNGDSADSGSNLPSTADQEALGNAMSRLDITGGQATAAAKKKAAVKVAAEDVSLLVCLSLFWAWIGVAS